MLGTGNSELMENRQSEGQVRRPSAFDRGPSPGPAPKDAQRKIDNFETSTSGMTSWGNKRSFAFAIGFFEFNTV
jgi:hypothetical protein